MGAELIFGIFYLGGAIYLAIKALRKRMPVWERAVESCGLRVTESAAGVNPQLKACSGDTEVSIHSSGESGRALVLVKVPGPPDFQKVRLRPQAQIQVTHEIEIGDKVFDGEFVIEGPMQLVSALLDQKTRQLLSAIDARLSLVLGELRANVPDAEISRVLPRLLEIRGRLSGPIDVPRRLAENARHDPVPGVRLHNLLVLVRELPDDPATAEAFREARSDPSPEVRLRVATALGAEGRSLLRELAEELQDDAVSAEAVATLGRGLPFESASGILHRALSRRQLRTARACLRSIGRGRAAEAVDLLTKVMGREQGDLAAVAAQALGSTGSPAAEAPLLQALRRDHAELRVAAAKELGHIGTAAAVLPLKEAAEFHRLDADLRRAARQAVAEIQSRVQGAEPGQLSLAGTEAGQLSLAGDEGRLSFPDNAEGRLSISDGD